jgi:hypothetical protein
MKPLRRGHPYGCSVGAISARVRPLPLTKRRIWFGVVWGRIGSIRPIDWKARSDSSSMPTPRG